MILVLKVAYAAFLLCVCGLSKNQIYLLFFQQMKYNDHEEHTFITMSVLKTVHEFVGV